MEVERYTDLSVEECVRRLSASGWAGDPAARRWRPTAADSNLLRKVHGERFWLRSRSWVAYWGEWELGFGPWQFSGQLQPCGGGTRVTGRYVPTALGGLVIVLFIAMVLGAVWGTVRAALTAGIVEALQLVLVAVVLGAVLATRFWLGAPYRRRAAEYYLHFLERTLEAREVDAERTSTSPRP